MASTAYVGSTSTGPLPLRGSSSSGCCLFMQPYGPTSVQLAFPNNPQLIHTRDTPERLQILFGNKIAKDAIASASYCNTLPSSKPFLCFFFTYLMWSERCARPRHKKISWAEFILFLEWRHSSLSLSIKPRLGFCCICAVVYALRGILTGRWNESPGPAKPQNIQGSQSS